MTTKRYPRFFRRKVECEVYDAIPKRVWAAIAKDLLVLYVGDSAHAEYANPEAWIRELESRRRILDSNDLL